MGQTDSHVEPWRNSERCIHREMSESLELMASRAERDGIRLEVCSGFRSFDRQLAIWNAKATGQRPVMDDHGRPIDVSRLSAEDAVMRILRWSALPGLSRHHWGTDIDVFDSKAVKPDYQVQLTLEESRVVFSDLHAWLDANMNRFGFYRPYSNDLGGIAPEPWHISFAAISEVYFESYSYDILKRILQTADLQLKDAVLKKLPEIFERYFATTPSFITR